MGRHPTPLPPEIHGQAFLAVSDDLAYHRTRAADLWAPTRGVRLPRERTDAESRCHAHTLTLPPEAVFSHTTAAVLWGLPLPSSMRDDIHITMPLGTRAPRRRATVGHQSVLASSDVRVVRGIRVTSPVRTFLDLADALEPDALVAVADRIISRRAPLATIADLEAAVEVAARRRGIRRARSALERMDAGSESPKETELRLVLTDAGFGPFDANYAVHDESGRFVARVDLALVRFKIAIEYEGDHHRDRDQWRRDIARRRRLEAAGWFYISVTQADLRHPTQLFADLSAVRRTLR